MTTVDRSDVGPAARHRRRSRAVPAGPDDDQRREARRRRARVGRDPEPEGPRARGRSNIARARRRASSSRARPRSPTRRARMLERYAVMDDVAFEPITGPAHQVLGRRRRRCGRAPIVAGAGARRRSPRPTRSPSALRIRAGFLRYGADVDEDHFPFETPLARFLDYGKGCYVGQEPVFRVHAQGNAARALRGLASTAPRRSRRGATIKHPAKANAGEVTSAIADGDGDARSRSATCTARAGTSAAPSRSTAGARRCTSCRGESARCCVAAGDRLQLHHRQLHDQRRSPAIRSRSTVDIDDRRGPRRRRGRRRHVVRTARARRACRRSRSIDSGADVDAARSTTRQLDDARRARRRPARSICRAPTSTARSSSTLHPCDRRGVHGRHAAATRGFDAIIGMQRVRRRRAPARRSASGARSSSCPNVAGDDAASQRTRATPSSRRRSAAAARCIVGGTELGVHELRRDRDRRVPRARSRPGDAAEPARHRRAVRRVDRVGVSMLAVSAYERYRADATAGDARAAGLELLPADTVMLPGGPVTGHATTIPTLALVGRRRRRARARRAARSTRSTCSRARTATSTTDVDCPCSAGHGRSARCRRSVELAPTGGLAVLVVDDDDPTLPGAAHRARARPARGRRHPRHVGAARDRARRRLPARPPARALHRPARRAAWSARSSTTTASARRSRAASATARPAAAAAARSCRRARARYSSSVCTPASTSLAAPRATTAPRSDAHDLVGELARLGDRVRDVDHRHAELGRRARARARSAARAARGRAPRTARRAAPAAATARARARARRAAPRRPRTCAAGASRGARRRRDRAASSRLRRALGAAARSCIPYSTLCSAVMCGNSARPWNTYARRRCVHRRRRCRAPRSSQTSSPSAMRPRSGTASPASTASTVLLPEPDGPITHVMPGGQRSSTSTLNSPRASCERARRAQPRCWSRRVSRFARNSSATPTASSRSPCCAPRPRGIATSWS